MKHTLGRLSCSNSIFSSKKNIFLIVSALGLHLTLIIKAEEIQATRLPINSPQPFSSLEYHIVTSQDLSKDIHSVIWEQTAKHPFNELIVSWNANRPHKGKMTFWVSVKHSTWSPWHRLAEWTSTSQRTFINKLNPIVHTKHVLVELQKGFMASAFRVKATVSHEQDKKKLKALFASYSNLKQFSSAEPSFSMPTAMIKGVPRQSQMTLDHPRKHDLCSPTSLSMILNYFKRVFTKKPALAVHDHAVEFAQKVHDQRIDIYGNWLLNVAQAYDSSSGNVFYCVRRLNGFEELYDYIKQKIPVAVSVRHLKGGATPYARGHFIVIIGWHEPTKSVVCIDPAFSSTKSTLKTYPIKNFLKAWSLSKNLAYVPLLSPSLKASNTVTK